METKVLQFKKNNTGKMRDNLDHIVQRVEKIFRRKNQVSLKLNEATMRDVETLLLVGLKKDDICYVIGVTSTKFCNWMKECPEFSRRVKLAEIKRKVNLLTRIEAAGESDWQALAWLLERLYPEEFSKTTKNILEVAEPVDVKVVSRQKHNSKSILN